MMKRGRERQRDLGSEGERDLGTDARLEDLGHPREAHPPPVDQQEVPPPS
jgi:hypothetical protein